MAEVARRGGTGPCEGPCLSTCDKGVVRQIGAIEIDCQLVSVELVELRVSAEPSRLFGGPIFANPMIFIWPPAEVRRKSASDTCRYRVISEQAAKHQRIVPTGPECAFAGWALSCERSGANRLDQLEPIRDGLGVARRRDGGRNAVSRRPGNVSDKLRHDIAKGGRVIRQIILQRGQIARIGQCILFRVQFRNT